MSCAKCRSCNERTQILAVILDLDGTLLNTEQVTKDVLKDFLAKYGKEVDPKKEESRLGMMQKEAAIAIVKDYDLPLTPERFIQDISPMYHERWPLAKPLPGANRLIMHLHKHGVPFALASNSVRRNIDTKVSHQPGWKERFTAILGSDEVKSGKPAPDLFLEAARRMGVDASRCLVIEDSLVGVEAARAAKMKVVAVPSIEGEAESYSIADLVLHSLLEFQPELWGLPPFEDWINNVLPIEPTYVAYVDGFLQEAQDLPQYGTDGGPFTIPVQLSGLFCGWATVDELGKFKVVVALGWDSCTPKRSFVSVTLLALILERNHSNPFGLPLIACAICLFCSKYAPVKVGAIV
ncbi:Haloacid dehalogenase-like hydrolase [Dillenia turbinata]|uniref:Haloacid dehalogenase-like hydrolase n=1 Tax=Dillenia turbinata TaxID=194707 RepID=A0AAN8Z0D9_9MAGN